MWVHYKDVFRFLDKIIGSDPSKCWEFKGTTDKNGYHNFWLEGVNEKAHRVAWAIQNGPIPDGLWVLHKCDNPPCCNPNHLFLGTAADNNADRDSKGRSWKGAQFNRSMLTDELVLKIREVYNPTTTTYKELALQFGVTPTTIELIVHGKTWKHVGGIKPRFARIQRLGERSKNNKITDKQAKEVKRQLANKVPHRAIAANLKVGVGIVHNISAGRAWTHV